MNNAVKIISVNPPYAIAGGEITIECENFRINSGEEFGVFFNGQKGRIVAASPRRVIVLVPEILESEQAKIYLEANGERSEDYNYLIGKKLADDLHIVSNPAIDPNDGAIILTRSGSRGQQMPVSLLRLESDGYLDEMPAEMLNPTAVAFNRSGNLFATNRADGEVCRINRNEEVVPYATGLGIATGLAFNKEDEMFVGDRSGTIYKVKQFGETEVFGTLEPSVSAYHFAFDANDRLYVTAPGLSSYDNIYVFDGEGYHENYFRGFGRPQGMAFDREGNLYIAACYEGKHGIVRVNSNAESAEMFVAGMSIVGLCFNKKGEMIIAASDSVYSIPVGIYGILLD